MLTVFVTGPLAGGKRTACEYLTSKGFAHLDLDTMAKELLFDEDVIRQLVDAYGQGILDETGSVLRGELAERAFVNEETSAILNGITWPLVIAKLSDLITGTSCQWDTSEQKLAVEIAMLAECPEALDLADTSLCITANAELRVQRALARGMQLDDVNKRMHLQASDEERNALCNAVILNNGTKEELYRKLDSWLTGLQQEHMF